jgi:protein ImuB
MPLAEATALFPELEIEPYDPQADRQGLVDLAEACRAFSPSVGVEEAAAAECLLLDVTGLEHLFGDETTLAEQALGMLAERGLWTRAAIADTLGGAWAVVHWAGERGTTSGATRPYPQPLSRLRERGGSVEPPLKIPPGQTAAALRDLPVEALRLPEAIVETLRPLGIATIGQLERLPRADLAARFGPELVRRWDQATGLLPEAVPGLPLAVEYQARQGLEYPTADREAVRRLIEPLVRRLAAALRADGRGAMRLDCRLQCVCGEAGETRREVDCSVGLFRPTASPEHLLGLVMMRLESVRLPGPVEAVSVGAAFTAPVTLRQEGLFDDDLAAAKRGRLLAAMVDRLANRLGTQAVLAPRFVPDAQPECSYRYEPLVGSLKNAATTRKGRGAGRSATANWDPPPRPLRLLSDPFPLTVVSVMPDGPPVRFTFRGEEHRVARCWGPERIETGWWRGPMVARDYYRIETAAGRRFWLFREREEERWFLHGLFE